MARLDPAERELLLRAATFGARSVALCRKEGPPVVFSAPGATAITFDGEGRLWVATGGRLLREEADQLIPVGDFSPISLAGHEAGVIALDAQGQLLSISPEGEVLVEVGLLGRQDLSVESRGDEVDRVIAGHSRSIT